MTPEFLSITALVCFALAAAAAIAGFRVEALRSSVLQFVLVGLGLLLKTAAIGLACSQNQTHFFNSPSEMVGLLAWSMSFSYLIALAISGARSLGAVVLPLVLLLSVFSLFFSKEGVGIAVPAGNVFTIHILSAFLGYGLFLTACGASLMYLEQASLLKRKVFGVLFKDLPSLEKIERLEIACAWLGFAIFTIAIVTGALMANRADKPFWLEPKFLSAQVTWLVFGLLVIGRAIHRLSGRTAAKFALAGAVLVLLTFALGHPFGRPATQNAGAVRSLRIAHSGIQMGGLRIGTAPSSCATGGLTTSATAGRARHVTLRLLPMRDLDGQITLTLPEHWWASRQWHTHSQSAIRPLGFQNGQSAMSSRRRA